jgi:hypothetical protein
LVLLLFGDGRLGAGRAGAPGAWVAGVFQKGLSKLQIRLKVHRYLASAIIGSGGRTRRGNINNRRMQTTDNIQTTNPNIATPLPPWLLDIGYLHSPLVFLSTIMISLVDG